jgi:hypothetical protein
VLGDRDYGDSEEFTCKSLVGTNLATEHHVLLIKLLKDPLERPLFCRQSQILGYLLCHCVPERFTVTFICYRNMGHYFCCGNYLYLIFRHSKRIRNASFQR